MIAYLVEGAVTVVFGVLCFFFMPDTPALATFLTAEEREWALRRMQRDASGSTTVDVDNEKFDWAWVTMALKAPQMYLCAAIWFFLLISLYVRPATLAARTGAADPRARFPELLALPALHHLRDGLHLYHRATLDRSAKHGGLCYGHTDGVLLG